MGKWHGGGLRGSEGVKGVYRAGRHRGNAENAGGADCANRRYGRAHAVVAYINFHVLSFKFVSVPPGERLRRIEGAELGSSFPFGSLHILKPGEAKVNIV